MVFLKSIESSNKSKLPPLNENVDTSQEGNTSSKQPQTKLLQKKNFWAESLVESKSRRQEANESARLLVNTDFAHVDTVRLEEKKPTTVAHQNDTAANRMSYQPVSNLQQFQPKVNLNVTFSDQFVSSRKDNMFGRTIH